MIDGISSNNLYANSAESRVMQRRLEQWGIDIDAMSLMFLTSRGNQESVINRIGLELGINETPSESNLSFDRYITAENDQNNYLFQGEDGNLYNLNFTEGTYSEISVNDFAEENGLIEDGDKFYDVVDFGQNKAEFTDYAFQGTGDGKLDKAEVAIGGGTWGSIKWVRQEVDQTLWGSGESSGNSVISNLAFSNIIKHKDQWLNATDEEELEKAESEEEYWEMIAEKAVEAMDETGKAEY